MQAAAIFVAGEVKLDWLVSRISMPGKSYYRSDREWVVERDGHWAVIEVYDTLRDELDEDELRRVEQFMPSCSGFILRFSDVQFASEVLRCFRSEQVVVDNDHGLIAPIATILGQPNWEAEWYRRES